MTERSRPWRCALCREQLGTVAHRRQGEPILHLLPTIGQVEVGDGEVRITCPACHATMRWVVHRQRAS